MHSLGSEVHINRGHTHRSACFCADLAVCLLLMCTSHPKVCVVWLHMRCIRKSCSEFVLQQHTWICVVAAYTRCRISRYTSCEAIQHILWDLRYTLTRDIPPNRHPNPPKKTRKRPKTRRKMSENGPKQAKNRPISGYVSC